MQMKLNCVRTNICSMIHVILPFTVRSCFPLRMPNPKSWRSRLCRIAPIIHWENSWQLWPPGQHTLNFVRVLSWALQTSRPDSFCCTAGCRTRKMLSLQHCFYLSLLPFYSKSLWQFLAPVHQYIHIHGTDEWFKRDFKELCWFSNKSESCPKIQQLLTKPTQKTQNCSSSDGHLRLTGNTSQSPQTRMLKSEACTTELAPRTPPIVGLWATAELLNLSFKTALQKFRFALAEATSLCTVYNNNVSLGRKRSKIFTL